MGMEKTSSQIMDTNSNSSTAQILINWNPLPEYPDTIINSNGLVVNLNNNSKVTANVTIPPTAGSASYSRGIHIKIDNVIVATDSTTTSDQSLFSASYTGLLSISQNISVYAWTEASNTGYKTVTYAKLVILPPS